MRRIGLVAQLLLATAALTASTSGQAELAAGAGRATIDIPPTVFPFPVFGSQHDPLADGKAAVVNEAQNSFYAPGPAKVLARAVPMTPTAMHAVR